MAFSTLNSFCGNMNNHYIPKIMITYKPAFVYYTCYTNNGSKLLNQYTNVYDGILSDLRIISTVNPALGTSCLTMNSDYWVTFPLYNSNVEGFSLCFWLRTNVSGGYYRAFQFATELIIFTVGSDVNINMGSDSFTMFSNVNDNVFRNFSVVFTANKTAIIYVNGVLYNTLTLTNSVSISNQGYIGSSDGSTGYFIGSIDDIRIYDSQLTASDVLEVYQNTY